MNTRKDYLDKKCSHFEYYRETPADAGVSYRNANSKFMERVRACLDEGDIHLNRIPLTEWDVRAVSLLQNFTLNNAFRSRGDYPTQAGLVCLVKQAARDAIASDKEN